MAYCLGFSLTKAKLFNYFVSQKEKSAVHLLNKTRQGCCCHADVIKTLIPFFMKRITARDDCDHFSPLIRVERGVLVGPQECKAPFPPCTIQKINHHKVGCYILQHTHLCNEHGHYCRIKAEMIPRERKGEMKCKCNWGLSAGMGLRVQNLICQIMQLVFWIYVVLCVGVVGAQLKKMHQIQQHLLYGFKNVWIGLSCHPNMRERERELRQSFSLVVLLVRLDQKNSEQLALPMAGEWGQQQQKLADRERQSVAT